MPQQAMHFPYFVSATVVVACITRIFAAMTLVFVVVSLEIKTGKANRKGRCYQGALGELPTTIARARARARHS